jgi:cytochrome c peroxidase
MGITWEHALEMLKAIPGYRKPFEAAFPGQSDPITMDNVEEAIAAFEATLITPNAPFDHYLQGDAEALSAEQKEGLKLFMDKGARAVTTASTSAVACTRLSASLRSPAGTPAAGRQGPIHGHQDAER